MAAARTLRRVRVWSPNQERCAAFATRSTARHGIAVDVSPSAQAAAEGADLIVSTEHDRVVDYGPTLARLGLADRLHSLVGLEMTSSARSTRAPETAELPCDGASQAESAEPLASKQRLRSGNSKGYREAEDSLLLPRPQCPWPGDRKHLGRTFTDIDGGHDRN